MSRNKKWASNDKDRLLVENFKKFMEEGDFSPTLNERETIEEIGWGISAAGESFNQRLYDALTALKDEALLPAGIEDMAEEVDLALEDIINHPEAQSGKNKVTKKVNDYSLNYVSENLPDLFEFAISPPKKIDGAGMYDDDHVVHSPYFKNAALVALHNWWEEAHRTDAWEAIATSRKKSMDREAAYLDSTLRPRQDRSSSGAMDDT